MSIPISTLLADDQALLRHLLAQRLNADPAFQVVAQTDTLDESWFLVQRDAPQLLIVDVMIKGRVIFETISRIRKNSPQTRIVFLASVWTDRFIRRAIELGVKGYLLKTEPVDYLLTSLRQISAGHTVYADSICKRLNSTTRGHSNNNNGNSNAQGNASNTGDTGNAGNKTNTDHADGTKDHNQDHAGFSLENVTVALDRLSAREQEVLTYLAQAMSRRTIAKAMHISENTVANHTSKLMSKLRIHDRVELARFAIREGLVEP